MQDDKQLEPAGLAKRPWLVSATLVHAIEEHDGDGVETGDGHGHTDVEQLGVEIVGDVEGLVPGGFREVRSREDRGEVVRRKFQQRSWREADANSGRARRGGQVEVHCVGDRTGNRELRREREREGGRERKRGGEEEIEVEVVVV